MLNKGLKYILNFFKPNVFVEINPSDIEISKEISDIISDFDNKEISNSNYIFFLEERKKNLYESTFKNNNKIKYYFYDLNFENSLLDNKILEEVEILFFNNVCDEQLVEKFLNIFKEVKIIIFDRYFLSSDVTLVNKSVNKFINKYDYFRIPSPENIFEEGRILKKYYVLAGDITNFLIFEKNKDFSEIFDVGVKFKYRVSDEKILDNIRKNINFYFERGLKEIFPCEVHDYSACLTGDGESFKKDHIYNSFLELRERKDHFLFSVDSSYEILMECNMKPFGCIFFDTGDHLVELAEKVDKNVLCFIGSHCNSEILKIMTERKINFYVYNMFFGIGEEEVFNQYTLKSKPFNNSLTSIPLSIQLLNFLGFYKFKLFGLDCSYENKPEYRKFKKFDDGRRIPFKIKLFLDDKNGEKLQKHHFWTNSEFLTMNDELSFYLKNFMNIKFVNYSEGLFKLTYDLIYSKRNKIEKLLFSR